MVILCFGDIFGRPGRGAVAAALPELKAKYKPDIIMGNAENLAGGKGVNRKALDELYDLGFHGFTSGNHIWDNKEVYSIMESDNRLIRPGNFPSSPRSQCPGRGFTVLGEGSKRLFIANVMGRIFMDPLDCPFQAIDAILKENTEELPSLVDIHAETTSEKYALGFFLDGRVSAVVGTHTHVQTSDSRLLPRGTAYITDIGMTGSFDSCIGMRKNEIITKFLTKRRTPFQIASENPGVCAVVIRLKPNGLAESIERIRYSVEER